MCSLWTVNWYGCELVWLISFHRSRSRIEPTRDGGIFVSRQLGSIASIPFFLASSVQECVHFFLASKLLLQGKIVVETIDITVAAAFVFVYQAFYSDQIRPCVIAPKSTNAVLVS